ncbi:hypothetical protein HALDL1_00345 (plasmid) [Halobacterium sp. DL1]|nr:hypothetical protein HALDL1_00345 [Halobacterium sp. DL1]
MDLAGILCEIMDIFPKNLHVLASVFEGLAFRFRDYLVLIPGTGSTFELHCEGDADITAFDVLRSCRLFARFSRFIICTRWLGMF